MTRFPITTLNPIDKPMPFRKSLPFTLPFAKLRECRTMQLAVLALSAIGFLSQSSSAGAAAEPEVVVIFGDSITAGSKLEPGELSQLWVLQVEAQSKGTLHTVNEGKGGRPTDSLGEFGEMLKRQPKADLLVIALGGNDARDTSGKCVPNALKNLEAMILRARKTYGAKLPILLVGPTNIRKDALGPSKPIADQREANLLALNAAYPELAKKENCAFVSLYGVLPKAGLGLDGVHPDAAGHDEITKVMLPAIARAAGVKVD
jgi:acyl-CoA thioesterase-1